MQVISTKLLTRAELIKWQKISVNVNWKQSAAKFEESFTVASRGIFG